MAKTLLVLGAGFAGATVAHLLKREFDEIVVIESSSHAGGGCRTDWYGGHPYTFGPRIFFSRDEEVIATLTGLVPVRRFDTISWTYVDADGQFYNYPLQSSDLPKMPDHDAIKQELDSRAGESPGIEDFERYWIDAIGPTLYGKFIDKYSKKMWGIESNRCLSAQWDWVNRGVPIRDGDVRLYTDQFQGYPAAADGYNSFFSKALEGARFVNRTRVISLDADGRSVLTTAGKFTGDVIVNTLPVDDLFQSVYGRLQYCGRTFLKFVLPVEHALPPDITWIHYSGDEPFTRITEFKKITGHNSPHTLLGIEIPDGRSRFYPVQSATEKLRFSQYQSIFPKNFFSIGRHGSFKYKGIPDAIRDALDVARAVRA